jgi:hypothetical protein
MWYEPVRLSNTSISKTARITRDRFGERVFGHIICMVVVKEQHGACLCV